MTAEEGLSCPSELHRVVLDGRRSDQADENMLSARV